MTKLNLLTQYLTAGALLLLAGCTGSGSVSSSGVQGSGTLVISLVYPTAAGPTWTAIMKDSRTYVQGLDLTVTGVCSRGVAKIKVNEGGADYSETASCDNSGSFQFNKTYTSAQQGEKTLNFSAYDASENAIAGATATAMVRIDNTPPASPVVTLPGANPYTHNGASSVYTITGTCSSETVKITGPAGVVITPVANAWSYAANLTAGSSTDFSFYAYDLAGNQSPVTTQTIVYTPSIDFKMGNTFPGGRVNDATNAFTLESTVYTYPSQASDTNGSGLVLQTGFNFITNSGRAN